MLATPFAKEEEAPPTTLKGVTGVGGE
jgi:hypothetical protein